MAIAGKSSAKTPVVGPDGRIDSTAAPSLQTELLTMIDDGAAGRIVDMARIRYVSSAGLRVLLVVAKALDKRGGRLVLCGVTPDLQHVFDVSGVF